jgi:ribonuclease HII
LKSGYLKAGKTDWLHFERKLWRQGYSGVAGVDEVGRGPLAGPVVAAAVIFPPEVKIEKINDSKRLTAGQREASLVRIQAKALACATAVISPAEIDRFNILNASLVAMKQAVSKLSVKPDILLIDGREKIPETKIPQQVIIKGDSKSQSIAAAGIIAKVTRDRLMRQLHQEYPQFGFLTNQGYATRVHKQALIKFGPCPVHRFSFSPVARAWLQCRESELRL